MQFYNVDGVEIPFEKNWNTVSISLSGGADSALLAYLLCTLMPNLTDLHCISHTRMWKTRPWQEWDSLRVFNFLKDKFPNINFHRHTNFIAPDLEYGSKGPTLSDEYGKTVSGDNIQQRAYAEYICHKHKIVAYYNAVTRNPKLTEFKGLPERDVEPSETNSHLRVMQHMEGWAIHPFRFIEKSWVIKQYYRLSMTELLELTRSCEGEFKDLNYTNYIPTQHVPICGECFWCKEREWAIDQHNK
jgi:hypothetical protein